MCWKFFDLTKRFRKMVFSVGFIQCAIRSATLLRRTSSAVIPLVSQIPIEIHKFALQLEKQEQIWDTTAKLPYSGFCHWNCRDYECASLQTVIFYTILCSHNTLFLKSNMINACVHFEDIYGRAPSCVTRTGRLITLIFNFSYFELKNV